MIAPPLLTRIYVWGVRAGTRKATPAQLTGSCQNHTYSCSFIGIPQLSHDVKDRIQICQPSAPTLEFLHPSRNLQPLIDGLGIVIEAGSPVNRLTPDAIGKREPHAFNLGTFFLPVIQVEFAFNLQCGIEHALARHDSAFADFIGRTVGAQGDFVIVVE